MPLSKIKNIVIAVLLAANLFFLAIVVADAMSDRRTERETFDNLSALCEKSGVSLKADVPAPDTEATAYAAKRSVDAEKKLAERLLGETESRESGGNVYSYTGERGTAVFRTGGEFSATIDTNDLHADGDPAKYAVKLLQEAGLTAEAVEMPGAPGETRVLAVCTRDRVRIWNCAVDIVFDGNSCIREMEGRVYCVGSARASGTKTTSAPTAVVAFISAVRSGEVSCTEVRSVELGYVMTSTPFGETELSPAWRVSADSGEYYIDAGTGELISGNL